MECKSCKSTLAPDAVACGTCGTAHSAPAATEKTYSLSEQELTDFANMAISKKLGDVLRSNRLVGIESLEGAAGAGGSTKSVIRTVDTGVCTSWGTKIKKVVVETASSEMVEFSKALADNIRNKTKITMRTITEGNGPSAGFLIPGEFLDAIMEKAVTDSYFLTFAPTINMSSDSVSWPQLTQTFGGATGNSDYFSGIDWAYIGEKAQKSESTNPSFRLLELRVKKVCGMQIVSQEMLDDAPRFLSYLINLVGRSWGWHVDEMMWRGDGVAEPLGFLTNPGLQTVARKAAGLVSIDDLVALERSLDPAFSNPVFCGRKSTIMDLAVDDDTVGQPRMQAIYMDPGAAFRPRTLLGRPVNETQHAPILGALGDVVLKDPSAFLIGLRKNLTLATSTDFLFDTDCIALRWIARWDSRIVCEDGIKALAV